MDANTFSIITVQKIYVNGPWAEKNKFSAKFVLCSAHMRLANDTLFIKCDNGSAVYSVIYDPSRDEYNGKLVSCSFTPPPRGVGNV